MPPDAITGAGPLGAPPAAAARSPAVRRPREPSRHRAGWLLATPLALVLLLFLVLPIAMIVVVSFWTAIHPESPR